MIINVNVVYFKRKKFQTRFFVPLFEMIKSFTWIIKIKKERKKKKDKILKKMTRFSFLVLISFLLSFV